MSTDQTQPDGDQRPIIGVGSHPIESTRYIIPTPRADEMCARVVHLLRLRNTGAIIYGPPRYGKSNFIELLRRLVAVEFKGAPTILLPAWDYAMPREKPFLSDLLTASGHALSKSGTSDQMRDRLVNFLGAQATQDGDGRVVLIVDEAQNLHEKHYNWLIGIHNILRLREINLIVLLIGQDELMDRRRSFIRQGKLQIVGRFMTQAFEFHGLRSSGDFYEVFQTYDEHTEFPPKSGWSFTRYYASKNFAEGWRLSSLSEEFWTAFREVHAVADKRSRRDIPMQYVCRAVEHFLSNLAVIRLDDRVAVRKLVVAAIVWSGYPETLLVT